MTTKTYNKLVRDKIPEIIKSSGKRATFEKVTGDEFLNSLNTKLDEELLKHKGIPIEEFEKIRTDKNDKRGTFDEGLILVEVAGE